MNEEMRNNNHTHSARMEQPLSSLRRTTQGATEDDDDPHLCTEGFSDDDHGSQLERHNNGSNKDEQQQQQQQQQKHNEPTALEYTACQIATWYPTFSKPQTHGDDHGARLLSHGIRRRRRTKGITLKSIIHTRS